MPASRDRTTSWNLAGDTEFRAWAQAIHDAIAAAGLVQTADTGQINLATVARPAAEGSAGYEIWRFDDADQATNPIYFRIQYERGDAATDGRLAFTVGKGSNGSGTITTPATTASSTAADAADTASRVIHAAFSDGAFVLVANANAAASGGVFILVIEREKNVDGDYDGCINLWTQMASSTTSQRWDAAWADVSLYPLPPGQSADEDGAVPVGCFWPNGAPRALRAMLQGSSSIFGLDDAGEVEVDGLARDYICDGLLPVNGGLGLGTALTAANMLVLNE